MDKDTATSCSFKNKLLNNIVMHIGTNIILKKYIINFEVSHDILSSIMLDALFSKILL